MLSEEQETLRDREIDRARESERTGKAPHLNKCIYFLHKSQMLKSFPASALSLSLKEIIELLQKL